MLVIIRNSEQDDHVMKSQLTGGGDKYPEDKIAEQRAYGKH